MTLKWVIVSQVKPTYSIGLDESLIVQSQQDIGDREIQARQRDTSLRHVQLAGWSGASHVI